MLKDFLNENDISIYSLSKKTNIPYSTLNDLCNGKVEIDNCKVSLLINLAKSLNMTIEKLYELCKNNDNIVKIKKYNTEAKIIVKNKKYYVQYNDGSKTNNIDLFKVNHINNIYVKDAAEWLVEDALLEKEMEDIYALQFNEKR